MNASFCFQASRVTLSAVFLISFAFMNDSSAEPPSISLKLQKDFHERTFVDAHSRSHRYRVLLPNDFDSVDGESKRYPLVLFLHGSGERGDDNLLQLKHGAAEFASEDRMAEFPCVAIFPQCPANHKWVDVDWALREEKHYFPAEPSGTMKAVLGIVDEWVSGGRIDPSRVYVTGISMGGYGTWYASALRSDLFAASIPICGGGDIDWAGRFGDLPLWVFHGTDDNVVPINRSREMVAAMKRNGHRPEPKFTEYEGGAHDVWTRTYKRDDVFEWLFSQRK